MIVVDSTIWIEVLRNPSAPVARTLRDLISENEAGLTEVIRAEIVPFVKSRAEQRRVDELFTNLPCAAVEPSARFWQAVVAWRRHFVLKGMAGIALPDVMIATVCLELDLPIWSMDGHFKSIAKHFPLEVYTFD